MFFEKINDIPNIARHTGCAIFVVPSDIKIELPKALILTPEEKSVITIEQVREVIARLNVKQTAEQFVVIRPAETLGEEAANAMLKSLEEPGEKVHFVLITSTPSQLLPTILSRSAIYFLKTTPEIDTGIEAEEKVKVLAKRLMVCRGAELTEIAEEICKKKDGMRAYALTILGTAIEISYKSYFKTGKVVFIAKIPKLLAAYKAIQQNGHVKLHLVADLL